MNKFGETSLLDGGPCSLTDPVYAELLRQVKQEVLERLTGSSRGLDGGEEPVYEGIEETYEIRKVPSSLSMLEDLLVVDRGSRGVSRIGSREADEESEVSIGLSERSIERNSGVDETEDEDGYALGGYDKLIVDDFGVVIDEMGFFAGLLEAGSLAKCKGKSVHVCSAMFGLVGDESGVLGAVRLDDYDVRPVLTEEQRIRIEADIGKSGLEAGKCYLRLVLKCFWPEASYLLGDWPSVAKFLSLPRYMYDVDAMRKFDCVVQGECVHVTCEEDAVSFVALLSRVEQREKVPAWMLVEGDIGGQEASVDGSFGWSVEMKIGGTVPPGRVKTTLIKGAKGKASCSHCKKVVDPVGHAEVCSKRPVGGDVVVSGGSSDQGRAVEVVDARRALVGDAMHALDVRTVVAGYSRNEKTMTIDVIKYTSAKAQRGYLERVDPGALGSDRSDHAWATVFEMRYEGGFRRRYLRWFVADMLGPNQVAMVSSDVIDMAKSHSSLFAQIVADMHG